VSGQSTASPDQTTLSQSGFSSKSAGPHRWPELASFRKTTLRVCGAPAPKFTAIIADAAWRHANAILRNEAKIIGSSAARTAKTYRRPDMKLLRLAKSAEFRENILRKLY
jgi:hypothetical protein